MVDHDIFISYRRESGENLAGRIKSSLNNRGYSVFMDVEDLKSGKFNESLYKKLEEATDVIVILTPGCLERCNNEEDWLRKEIKYAITCSRNIVPVLGRDFIMPQADALPSDIADISYYNSVSASHDLFEASMDKLSKFLKSSAKNKVNPVKKNVLRFIYIFGAIAILTSLIIAVFVKQSILPGNIKLDNNQFNPINQMFGKSMIMHANVNRKDINVVVVAPPNGDVSFFINDKDVSASIDNEVALNGMKTYKIEGTPTQLNVHVGFNKLVAKYGSTELPPYKLKYSDHK